MSDRNKTTNPNCPCTWQNCPRHGVCAECRAYHRGHGQKTACEKQRK